MPARETVLELLGPSTGGIRRHVGTLAAELAARGWEVVVAGPPGVMAGAGGQDKALPVGLAPAGLAGGRRALRALVRDRGVGLVHAHGLKAGWLAAVGGLGVPVVLTVHNVVLPEKSSAAGYRCLRLLERLLPGRVDRAIAVSAEIASRFPGAMEVVPPCGPRPVPVEAAPDVRRRLGVGPTQPLVVTVARLNVQKDLGTLLAAAEVVVAERPEARFVVVGEGPERGRLEVERAARGLEGAVSFAGYRPNPADEVAAADVVALSSRWEGSPLAVAEAMLLGRPVAATAVGAVPEVVVDGRTGRLAPAGDGRALGRAILELLADPAGAGRLAEAGRRAAEARFDTARLVDAVAAVYDSVAPGPRPAGALRRRAPPPGG